MKESYIESYLVRKVKALESHEAGAAFHQADGPADRHAVL